ncbi:MAG TPA: hypothetical protein VMT52_11490 [Planctomycetota bacterium]|nr:hypothetical protein [Planctomycetota bacterium]
MALQRDSMTEAQLSKATTLSRQDQSSMRLIQSMTYSASSLSKQVLYLAIFSASCAMSVWLLCFSSFLFDSFKSATACIIMLVAMIAPSVILYRFHRALSRLSSLPERFAALKKLDIAELKAAMPATPEEDRSQKFHLRVWSQINALIEVQALVVGAKEDLLRCGGAAAAIGFIANPLTAILVVVSASVTILLTVSALLAIVWTAVSIVF